METIATARLLLMPSEMGDAPFILRLLNEPSFLENIGDKGVRTLADAENYLQTGPMASYLRHGHGLMAVVLPDTAQPIGMCGLLKRDYLDHVDLGYAFLPEFWSQGYAREAAEGVLLHGRRTLGLTHILALVTPSNQPSIRLLEKVGFSFSKLLRQAGDTTDTALYERVQAQSPTDG